MFGLPSFFPVVASMRDTAQRSFTLKRFSSIYVVAAVYPLLILLGMLLLSLPCAQRAGVHIPLLDCLFTSASALTLTGLITVSTAESWSFFGKIVILALIQTGGLSYLTLGTAIALRLGLRLGLRAHLRLPNELSAFNSRDAWRVMRYAVFTTLTIEGAGACALFVYLHFHHLLSWGAAAFSGIFYAVSAFCNAGFDLAPGMSGFAHPSLRADNGLLLIIGFLALLGALGIITITELIFRAHTKRLSLHARLSLIMTAVLIVLGMLFILLFEARNPHTLASLPDIPSRIVSALFLSVTARTAGFSPLHLTGRFPTDAAHSRAADVHRRGDGRHGERDKNHHSRRHHAGDRRVAAQASGYRSVTPSHQR